MSARPCGQGIDPQRWAPYRDVMRHPNTPSAPRARRIAILGTVGVPGRYGGFETLAEALVNAAAANGFADRITVACSSKRIAAPRPSIWRGAKLKYFALDANGVQSILYDTLGLLWAARTRQEAVLLLGVSGAIALPLMRAISKSRMIVHVDGIEWQRPKWRGLAKAFLRLSERLAVRWAHQVISDNAAITAYLKESYGVTPSEITYGSDQAQAVPPGCIDDLALPGSYALSIARVEPENNLEMIIDAFSRLPDAPLVIVGNWTASAYGKALRDRAAPFPHIRLLDAEYDPERLRAIRDRAALYIHGHSAGGTNPSLVEMLPFAIPIAAFDCAFNRETTGGKAAYFSDAEALAALVPELRTPETGAPIGEAMAALAQARYRWSDVTDAYFQLLDG